MNLNSTDWRQIFKLAKQICRENKLKEFHYKFVHRIIVPRENYTALVLNRIVIVYIVEFKRFKTPSNIPLLTANFQKLSSEEFIQWFNNVNYTNQHPSVKETLFGLFPTSIANKTR